MDRVIREWNTGADTQWHITVNKSSLAVANKLLESSGDFDQEFAKVDVNNGKWEPGRVGPKAA